MTAAASALARRRGAYGGDAPYVPLSLGVDGLLVTARKAP